MDQPRTGIPATGRHTASGRASAPARPHPRHGAADSRELSVICRDRKTAKRPNGFPDNSPAPCQYPQFASQSPVSVSPWSLRAR